MATFEVSPLFRSTAVGFDRPWNSLNTAMSLDSAGEPAYNILKLDDDEYRISLAVPGFTREEITIETREGSLWIKGERAMDPHHNQYLYKGVGTDGFQRTFQLPEYVKVSGARLEAGMLHVDLIRELPDALKPQRIEVVAETDSQRVIEDASRAA